MPHSQRRSCLITVPFQLRKRFECMSSKVCSDAVFGPRQSNCSEALLDTLGWHLACSISSGVALLWAGRRHRIRFERRSSAAERRLRERGADVGLMLIERVSGASCPEGRCTAAASIALWRRGVPQHSRFIWYSALPDRASFVALCKLMVLQLMQICDESDEAAADD